MGCCRRLGENDWEKGVVKMYVRVDYKDWYIYFANDTEAVNYATKATEYRSKYLLKENYACQRMKRLSKLPPGKEVNIFYSRQKALDKSKEV